MAKKTTQKKSAPKKSKPAGKKAVTKTKKASTKAAKTPTEPIIENPANQESAPVSAPAEAPVAKKREPRKREEVIVDKQEAATEAAAETKSETSSSPAFAGDGTDSSGSVEDIAEEKAETIVEVLSSKPRPVLVKELLSHSGAILHHLKAHFRPSSINEIKELLNRSKFPFHYTIKKRGDAYPNEVFIELTDGNNKARCPINTDEFITIAE